MLPRVVYCAGKAFTDSSGFINKDVEVVFSGDGLLKKCPVTPHRVGEEGGKLATLPYMQVSDECCEVDSILLIAPNPWLTF